MTIGVARAAIPHTFGFDTVQGWTQAELQALHDHPWTPMRWIALFLGDPNAAAKRDAAFALGMPILLVTFSRASGWVPSSSEGQVDGAGDVERATSLGAPPTVHIMSDLEGCSGTVQTTEDWANARGGAQKAAGYSPGIYVAAGQALQGVELSSLVQTSYWQGLSVLTAPGAPPGYTIEPSCGWGIRQLPHTVTLAGVNLDVNVIQYDWRGRLPTLWWPE
jgi:hypothetical protein